MHSYRLASDEAQLRADVENLQSDKSQLEQVRDYLRTDEYVEFMARRIFGLVNPGEKLVIVNAPTPQDQLAPDTTGQRWWEKLFGN